MDQTSEDNPNVNKYSTVSEIMNRWLLHSRFPHELYNKRDKPAVQEIGFQICTTPIVQEIFPGTTHNFKINELDQIRSELFPDKHDVTGIRKIKPQYHVPVPKLMIDQVLDQILVPTAIDDIYVWLIRYTEFTPEQAIALGALQISSAISQGLSDKPERQFMVAPKGYEVYRSYLVKIDPNISVFAKNTDIPRQKISSYNTEFPENVTEDINSQQIIDNFFQYRYIPIFPFDNKPQEWFTNPQGLQIA